MALARTADGQLSPYIEAFASSLIEQRYSAGCVRQKVHCAAGFSGWLALQSTGLRDPNERAVSRYLQERPRGRHRPQRDEPHALRQLLTFLRNRGAIDEPIPADDILPVDRIVRGFRDHLQRVRGLAGRTIFMYTRHARQFLNTRFGSQAMDLHELRAAEVIDFVHCQARRSQPSEVKRLSTALRSFLRYAQSRGDVEPRIVAAVPAVASWSVTPALPRAIAAEHARAALEACDRRTAVGRRDHAVLLLLARLGLRSAEIAGLLLDDLDWDASRLRVRGKGGREAWLPLPADVGQAIAAYLQDGRPIVPDRHLFLRAQAPIRGFSTAVAIGSIVACALARAGIDAPRKGAHQFRHALATQMLRRGASLSEIGELLRHRSPQTTALYARVDLVALRALALAWPGGAQ